MINKYLQVSFMYNNNILEWMVINFCNTNTQMNLNNILNSYINHQNNIENSSANSQIINSKYLDLNNIF